MNKSTTEIRQAFLDFFHSKGHQIIASSSLVPNNDPTLLFTNSGMNQFKNIFLGLDKRDYSRATTSQRCLRVSGKHNDLENVGYTARHHTFFNMLGNFSFGDYFKYDAIQYAWELLTDKNWFNLPKERLLVTVYKADNETYEIWKKETDILREHIIRIGDKKNIPYSSDNFWQMGDTGPCGPCTEIFYDYGDHIWGGLPGSAEENGDRYVEIWNIVFMQFNRQADGTMKLLPKPSVDTGMGLERIAAVMQQVNSTYEIDLFQTLIVSIAKIIGVNELSNKSLRVIADHIRSCAFLIADGIVPSNENRGYVLRRIIRRAIRHGNILGLKEIFFYKLVEPLIKVMGLINDDLKHQQAKIEQVLKNEEKQFSRTLDHGLAILNKELEKLEGNKLNGETLFRLYDTYGLPTDLTAEVCRERNIKVDETGFEIAMTKQRQRASASSNFSIDYKKMILVNGTTQFEGYNYLDIDSNIIALFINSQSVDNIIAGQDAVIFLDKTPFYAESGGQIGDKGEIKGDDFIFVVKDTKKYGQAIGHLGKLIYGSLKLGERVQAKVNEIYRIRICLNHSATHLIHAALRAVLGIHIIQQGSLVNDKMLRFDFSHFEAMKLTEIISVEDLVNTQIRRNLPIKTTIMDLNKARKKGAIALFYDKYTEHVRVIDIGDFSTEICGGTHASQTGDIGLFRIISESGIAAGIRRIKAVTGEAAIASIHEQENQLYEITQLLKTDSKNLSDRVRNTLKRIHYLEKNIQRLKEQITIQESANLFKKTIEIKGTNLLVSELTGIEPKMLRTMVNNLKNQLGSSIIVLATVVQSKISLIAGVSKDLIDRINAEELICMVAHQINGKGGGCSEIAQAGGTNIETLSVALSCIEGWVSSKL